MSDLIGIITSAFGGGLTGLLGHGIKEWLSAKRLDKEARIKAEERAHELAVMRLEAETAGKVAAIQTEGAAEVASYDALVSSYQHDKATYSARFDRLPRWAVGALVMVDVVRGVTRPALTATGIVAVSYLAIGGAEEWVRLEATRALVYVTTAAFLWWFADRPKR